MNYKQILKDILEKIEKDMADARKTLEDLEDCYSIFSGIDRDNANEIIFINTQWKKYITEKMEEVTDERLSDLQTKMSNKIKEVEGETKQS